MTPPDTLTIVMWVAAGALLILVLFLLSFLAVWVRARLAGADAAAVWSELSANVPTLAGLDGRLLPAEGVALDGAAFAAHKFPEGKLLKFAPVATA